MKSKFIVVSLISSFSVSSFADEALNTTPAGEKEVGCASVVCKNVIVDESVTKAGEFPERKGNETLSSLGSVLFIAGEIGLAENLQEEDADKAATE